MCIHEESTMNKGYSTYYIFTDTLCISSLIIHSTGVAYTNGMDI